MLVEIVQRLETKIEKSLKDFAQMQAENHQLREECKRLLREREILREGLDRIIARIDELEETKP
jgi:FtsZ-binding cell division protein ZapB